MSKIFCAYCGKQIDDSNRFCPFCGRQTVSFSQPEASVSEPSGRYRHQEPLSVNNSSQEEDEKKSKKGLFITLIVLAAVVLLAAGAAFAFFHIQGNHIRNELNDYYRLIESNNIPLCTEQAGNILKDFSDLKFYDLGKKKALAGKLYEVYSDSQICVQTISDAAAESESNRTFLESFKVNIPSYNDLEDSLDELDKAIEDRDITEISRLSSEIEEKKQACAADGRSYVENLLEGYSMVDLSSATEEDKAAYSELYEKATASFSSGNLQETYDYLKELEPVFLNYVLPETELNASVQQIDVSDYPNIKVYLNITDPASGEAVENLDNTLFYIRKQDANGEFIKQVIKTANQLDELEALNINMVADISGSMDGSPLSQAKTVMTSFVNSVQFDAGDLVELTSFSDGVYLDCPFTADAQLVRNSIDRLITYDMTALYDALYTAVNRVAAMQGAKCVIAFTDGLDNYSNVSISDVIAISQRYHVPIFIIGIGSNDYSNVRSIAEQTGGEYFNILSVSDMSDIYERIYRLEKQLYMIEFEDSTDIDLYDESSIVVGYHSVEYGCEAHYIYTPYTLVSVENDILFSDGPEKTVCAYMKGFADAMTNEDYSYIAPYIQSGSDMETSQRQFVTHGIDEILDSYEIENVQYSGSDRCVVTTRESYFVQKKNKPLELLTQRCKYNVVRTGGTWYITGFAEDVDVLSNIQAGSGSR